MVTLYYSLVMLSVWRWLVAAEGVLKRILKLHPEPAPSQRNCRAVPVSVSHSWQMGAADLSPPVT